MPKLALAIVLVCLSPMLALADGAPVDWCTGFVDPYNPIDQRGRFFQAAGVDGELSAAEFQADQGRPGGFAQRFDRWDLLRVFDRNRNGTIDWFEADAYRKGLRQRVLNIFDADGDGQLVGAERASANRSLAAGQVSRAAGRPPRPAPTTRATTASAEDWRRFDRNGDGRLDPAERRALEAHQLELRRQREAWLQRYDSDHDGQFSATERKAAHDDQIAQRRREYIRTHDTNGDGRLDAAEAKAAREKLEAYAAQQRLQAERDRFDRDQDGTLSAAEKIAYDAWRKTMEQARKRERDRYDADGDGEIDAFERKAMRQDIARRRAAGETVVDPLEVDDEVVTDEDLLGPEQDDPDASYRERLLRKYDADGDGVLSPSERAQMWHDQFLKGLMGPEEDKKGAEKTE